MHKLLLFITILSGVISTAAADSISIRTIPNIQQLPVNAIHRLYQDKEGYMWYGTVEGLCRDDGYQIVTFHTNSGHGNPNTNNPVTSIIESPTGDIWFGTDNGCYILHKPGYFITPVENELLGNVRTETVGVDKKGNVYVSIPGKLFKFSDTGILLHSYDVVDNATISNFRETQNGKEIWLSGWGHHLMLLDTEHDSLSSIPDSPRINTLALSHDEKNLLMSTLDGRIYAYDIHHKEKGDFFLIFKDNSDEVVISMLQDDIDGNLWVTTNLGLRRFTFSDNGLLEKQSLQNDDLHANIMLSEIIRDNSDNLWVSAFDVPSFIIERQSTAPRHYPLPGVNTRFNNKATVIGLAQGNGSTFWFNQERSGLCLYDLEENKLSFYKDFPATAHMPLGSIKELTISGDGSKIWVVPFSSRVVYQLQHKNLKMDRINSIDISELTNNTVQKLWEDKRGTLWIGTDGDLLNYQPIDKKTRLIKNKIGNITDIRESALGSIWIATADNGLWKINPDGKCIPCPGSEQYNIVSVSPSPNGDTWFATDTGDILVYSSKDQIIKYPDFEIPIERCAISHVHADDFNHIWIVTNQKVVEFNPTNGASHLYMTSENGMPWRILPTSFCINDEGCIVIGGIPGISKLTPSPRLELEPSESKTYISDVKVAGKSVLIGDSTVSNTPSEIYLGKDDFNIDIYFTSLNHLYASKIRYAYRLKDLDKEWIRLEPGKNMASFATMPPGTHTLEICSTDENDQWSKSVTTLKIHRQPAFHETWWFGVLVLLIVCAIIGFGIYAYVRYLKRKNIEISEDTEEISKLRAYVTSTNDDDNPQYEELNRILLRKITSVIENNLSDTGFSVDTLAREMNMSRSTLTRKMKTSTGLTPLEFIRQVKMRHAKALLSDKDRSISEVAFSLGYDNSKYFTQCFKNSFGMTPSEYQKSK